MKKGVLTTIILTIFMALILTSGVSAANKTVTPGKHSIQNAIITSSNGDILNLVPGTYYEHDILVNKNLTINGPKQMGHGLKATVNAQNLGRAFKTCMGVKLTLNYLQIQNGNAFKDKDSDYGGGIYSRGRLTLNNCNILDNKARTLGGGVYCRNGVLLVSCSGINHNIAKFGGGISVSNPLVLINSNVNKNTATIHGGGISTDAKATIRGSNINCNVALYQGGGIYTSNNLNIANTNLYFNTAKYSGGAIFSSKNPGLSITSCNLIQNSASNFGGAVYTGCMDKNRVDYAYMKFSRIFGNKAKIGKNICCMNGYFNASLNWWGSNNNPAHTVAGNVSINPRLILGINVNPNTILVGDDAKVTTDLRHDSNGCYHDPANGHVPNLMLSLFSTLGSIKNSIPMYRGSATAKLVGANVGSGYVFAVLDCETVRATVKISPLHKIIGFECEN